MAFDVNSLGGKLIDNKELKKLIENGGGGSANPLEPFPLFPKATKTTEIFVYEDFEYLGFLFNGLDLSGVNEDTVFKFTIGETSAYYPFSSYYKESINFHNIWVFPDDGRVFIGTNEPITAEVELDVMPSGFVETFVINGTLGDTYIETDKSKDDFINYYDKWLLKPKKVALKVGGDSSSYYNEIIYVGSDPAFIERGENISVDGSTNKLQIHMDGYKWVSDNALDTWEHTFEV